MMNLSFVPNNAGLQYRIVTKRGRGRGGEPTHKYAYIDGFHSYMVNTQTKTVVDFREGKILGSSGGNRCVCIYCVFRHSRGKTSIRKLSSLLMNID
jgi:hypothetical protein